MIYTFITFIINLSKCILFQDKIVDKKKEKKEKYGKEYYRIIKIITKVFRNKNKLQNR